LFLRAGKAFVSSIEGKLIPVYATQWHPEKNQFEWNPEEGPASSPPTFPFTPCLPLLPTHCCSGIDHSAQGIAVMSQMSQFFVNQARLSNRAFDSEQELESVCGAPLAHVVLQSAYV
jgi:gamma-glutamyl hydrolase